MDQIKTAFSTPYGALHYIMMPFGLKNTGVTYQCCMQACLHDQIGRNVQVYVDDIMVKTKKSVELLAYLVETVSNVRRYNMKLNLEKCVYGVPLGQLLSFLIFKQGIKANLEKIKAILRMGKLENLKTI